MKVSGGLGAGAALLRCQAGLVVVTLAACAPMLKVVGYPPEAVRKEAPASIERRALMVGSTAPALDVALTDGTSQALHGRRTVVLFYRGSW
jgi:hypothetical protein